MPSGILDTPGWKHGPNARLLMHFPKKSPTLIYYEMFNEILCNNSKQFLFVEMPTHQQNIPLIHIVVYMYMPKINNLVN